MAHNKELANTYSVTIPSILTELYTVMATFMWNSCLEHSAPSPCPCVLTTNLYSDIKPDDSPVKGTKKGKGKKDKKKPAVDPYEKKKPKLDELKVYSCDCDIQTRS